MELCRGCFGAANNDCRDCVRKKGEVSYKKMLDVKVINGKRQKYVIEWKRKRKEER